MVDRFIQNMKDAITGNNDPEQDADYERQDYPVNEDPYNNPAGDDQFGDVQPASEDPYGYPAEQVGQQVGDYGQFGDVRPASEDPYGDPADQMGQQAGDYGQFGDVRPASEDPYGDPADQENY